MSSLVKFFSQTSVVLLNNNYKDNRMSGQGEEPMGSIYMRQVWAQFTGCQGGSRRSSLADRKRVGECPLIILPL